MAEHTASEFLKVAARKDRLLKDEKAVADSWSRYMHKHMNCVRASCGFSPGRLPSVLRLY